MNNVIDITTKNPLVDNIVNNSSEVPTKENSKLEDLLEFLKEFQELEDFLICIKDSSNELTFFRSNELSIIDRSFIIQVLQSDLQEEMLFEDL